MYGPIIFYDYSVSLYFLFIAAAKMSHGAHEFRIHHHVSELMSLLG